MAVGDLVTAPYMLEYNNLAIGSGTLYDILELTGLFGFDVRTDSVTKFGRHGGVSGRHYSEMKNVTIRGNFLSGTDAEFQTNRRALATAFNPIIDPLTPKQFVFRLPDASPYKLFVWARPVGLNVPLNRDFSLKYAPYSVRLEIVDPIIYSLVPVTSNFTMPLDDVAITNEGNAPATWIGTLAGPCDTPILTNTDTGQLITFVTLALTGGQALVYDSSESTVKLNGASSSTSLGVGYSWWNLEPGVTNIRFEASNAGTAAFSIVHYHAFWLP